jgi:hypothetical protein
MPYTLHIDERLRANGDLVNHVKARHYRLVLPFFKANYLFYFLTDQSGSVFESCVDFCAETAGNVDDAKQVLIRLFDAFFKQLPTSVQERLAYLGEEIGYDPERTNLQKLKRVCGEIISATTIVLRSMLAELGLLMVRTRRKSTGSIRLPHPQLHHDPVQLMPEDDKFILDIPRELDLARYQSAA